MAHRKEHQLNIKIILLFNKYMLNKTQVRTNSQCIVNNKHVSNIPTGVYLQMIQINSPHIVFERFI